MSKPQEMKWRIVAFNHPTKEKSVLYRQKLTTKELIQAVERSIELGANLLSIRGFRDYTTGTLFTPDSCPTVSLEKPQSLQ